MRITCKDCPFSYSVDEKNAPGLYHCFGMPPSPFPVQQPGVIGGQSQMGMIVMRPQVNAETPACSIPYNYDVGEFEPEKPH